jgi:hypothetical protein
VAQTSRSAHLFRAPGLWFTFNQEALHVFHGNVTIHVSRVNQAVRFAGKFTNFGDPAGNPLYLAQLDWSHIDQGQGQYPKA